jgi:hypothetical protein
MEIHLEYTLAMLLDPVVATFTLALIAIRHLNTKQLQYTHQQTYDPLQLLEDIVHRLLI